MNNFFRKIFSLTNPKDQISGKWTTEDGSGFSIMMGSSIEFNPDGTGKYQSWGSGNDDTGYEIEGEFLWNRLGKSRIEIIELPNYEKTILDYIIEEVDNRIELRNAEIRKIGEIELEEFWNFAQIVFKTK